MAPNALTPRDSFTEMTELVLPQHANALGTAFGGTVMSWIDICAAVVAQRHCGRIAVTAAIDDLQFLAPIRVGDVVRLTGRANAAFRTSLEIEVLVEIERTPSRVRELCADAKLTFVNVDESGKPLPMPDLRLETDDDRARAEAAAARRAIRLAQKKANG
ncbi:MAG: acyl-CoA thioesterase [Polyangiales bacterium]|nr:acyl-CoA thioesterase [Myxococcales bacterium]